MDVYRHLIRTYGRKPAQWLGYGLVLTATIINRIVIVLFMAAIAASIAGGDFEAARRNAVYFLLSYVAGSLIWTVG